MPWNQAQWSLLAPHAAFVRAGIATNLSISFTASQCENVLIIRVGLQVLVTLLTPTRGARMDSMENSIRTLMGLIKVLIVDDEHYTRKVIRTLLLSIGCTKVHEANDGLHGLEAIRAISPGRARVPAQAGVEQRVAGAHSLGAHQAAHHGQARRLLRARAAQARELQAGGREL
jgi:hypothetical protein